MMISVILALLMLVATNSYAISSHFCGGNLVDVSYFGKSSGCCSMVVEDDCNPKPVVKKSCCVETLQIIDANISDFSKDVYKEFELQQFAVSFLYSYINLFKEEISKPPLLLDLPPPDIEENYQVLYQTFLI